MVIWLVQHIALKRGTLSNQVCTSSYVNSEVRYLVVMLLFNWQNMFIQQWVAQDGILMDHSSQQLLLIPFITWFLYRCEVTLCLHLLMKLSRISNLQRETSGKDCGWWVIDELDQFIPWYIHIRLHKRRWTSYWEFCIVSWLFDSIWTTAVKCFWNLQ